MAKRSIAVYVEQDLYNRMTRARSLRERVSPPGWKSVSSYAAYLIEEGLKLEEVRLQEKQTRETSRRKE